MTSISTMIAEEQPCGIAIGDGEQLSLFIGNTVTVYCGPFARGEDCFETMVSVSGTLEGQDDEDGNLTSWRVLTESEDAYAYFQTGDVHEIRYGVFEVNPEDHPDGPPAGMHCIMDNAGTATYWTIAERLHDTNDVKAVIRITPSKAGDTETLDNGGEISDNPPRHPSTWEAS
jgi:hypothetical protein